MNRQWLLRIISIIVFLYSSLVFMPVKVGATGWWQPTPSAPIHWQWQIGDDFIYPDNLVTNPTVSIPPGGPIAGEFLLLKTLLALGPVLLLLYFIFMPLINTIKSIKSQGLGMGALKILVFYALGIILFIALFPQIVHLMYAIMTM